MSTAVRYSEAFKLQVLREIDEGLIVELVKRERRMQPRLGGRKLLHLLQSDLDEVNVSIGRDRFFEVLAEHDLLVVRKPGRPRTTNSRHSLPVFGNLMEGRTLSSPNLITIPLAVWAPPSTLPDALTAPREKRKRRI